MNQLIFNFIGQKNDPGYTFDVALQGSKIFVVSGILALYGYGPTNTMTRLAQTVTPGAFEITVEDASGWKVNDTITIAPSFRSATQYERVQITNIVGNVITFDPPLQFTHYGDNGVTISNSVG